MCGIAGFWQRKRGTQHPLEVLKQMGIALAHRGPDDSGCFYDSATGLGLSFRRLSILDLSPAGHQPMDSASGRYTIIFNGEVYNCEEIRKELGPGYKWRGHSDTEVMLEAVERWGVEAAVQRFVGMFAFALWDGQERKLFLVRDRLGIKPLYYGFVGGDFVFASELKAILEYPGFVAEIDRGALALYMRLNYVPAPHCIYQRLDKLPPGHLLVLNSQGVPRLRQYWSASEIARTGLQSRLRAPDAEVVSQMEEELLRAVKLRMIADVPLGAFLSGGVDSSTVVALMQAQSSRPVKTFTVGFHEDDYNEAAQAKCVAMHLGTDHTELCVTAQETMDVIPLLARMYDEPFADASQIPTLLVSQLARRSVTVALSGDGGDELFAGYTRYAWAEQIGRTAQLLPAAVRRLAAAALRSLAPQTWNRLFAFVPASWRPALPGDKLHKITTLLDNPEPDAIYRRLVSQWERPDEVAA